MTMSETTSNPTASSKTKSSSNNNHNTDVVVKARWRLLRNAFLQATNKRNYYERKDEENHNQHLYSIHRFPGYQLVSFLDNTAAVKLIHEILMPSLNHYHCKLNACSVYSLQHDNVPPLEVAILSLVAATTSIESYEHRGGNRNLMCHLELTHSESEANHSSTDIHHFISILQERCNNKLFSVSITSNDQESAGETTTTGSTTTLLIQQDEVDNKDVAIKRYTIRPYVLDRSSDLYLWTRQPLTKVLSLQEIFSHKIHGVDNTGNICVWDSELTLTYVLYHDLGNELLSLWENRNQQDNTYILEVGTGMAGLSAYALGLRLAKQQQSQIQKLQNIAITLTDGNPQCVLNNEINRYLNYCYYSHQQQSKQLQEQGTTVLHPYSMLDVQCGLLLWTTDMDGEHQDQEKPQCHYDVVLISDCIHFQNVHDALLVTVLRSLRVHGRAIFCQPTRGDSLNTFCTLLSSCSSSAGTFGHTTNDENEETETDDAPLLSWQWWSPSVLEEAHQKAKLGNSVVTYDESLHRPKILIVKKSRPFTKQDRDGIVAAHQKIQAERKKGNAK